MDCKFCKSILNSVSSLNYHIKNNKKCLEIQSKTIGSVNSALVKCEYCNRTFANIKKHIDICKEKKKENKKEDKNIIVEYEKKIQEHKDYIIKLETEINVYNEKILKPILKPNKNLINNEDMTFKLILENGEIMNIGIRSDGYINATQLCKAGGKEFKHYKESKQTQDYLQALSSVVGIPTTDLIDIKQGGVNQGTYVHRKVSYHMSQWISPYFSVQVSNVLDNLFITGKVEIGNEKSNKELENLYQEKINKLQNRLNNYETTIFNRNVDYCPIEYYGKDIVYFIKFNIPTHLHSEYISKYPNVDNEDYSCIEFGVTSDIEERLKSHKRDKKKENLIFLHAIEIKNRYTSSKMEFYIKTLANQLNVKFEYEKRKECILLDEENFNILVNKIKIGLSNIEYYENDIKQNENEEFILEENQEVKYHIEIKKIEKEFEFKKFESITELLKTKIITLNDYKDLLKLL